MLGMSGIDGGPPAPGWHPGGARGAIPGHMKLNTLEELFHHELQDLYSAEKQLVRALPQMARAAMNPELAAGFEQHWEETKVHVNRLEQIGQELGVPLGRVQCKAMEGLVAEGAEMIQEDGEENVRDAGLISAAQRVEHYEIAGYGTARALALKLDLHAAADLLSQTLAEEKAADQRLTVLAESSVNETAQAASQTD